MHLSIGIHTRTPQDNLDAFLSHVIQALQLAKRMADNVSATLTMP